MTKTNDEVDSTHLFPQPCLDECPRIKLNNLTNPVPNEIKYLSLILGNRLTWRPCLKNKTIQLKRTLSFKTSFKIQTQI